MRTNTRVAAFLATLLMGFGLSQPAASQAASDVVCEACVDTTDIRNAAVTRQKIRRNAVSPNKLAPEAKPAGVARLFYEFSAPSDGSTVGPVGYIVLTPPASTGHAIIQAAYDATSLPSDTLISCFITRDGTPIPEASRAMTTDVRSLAGSIVWAEPVGAGPINYGFACTKEAGGHSSGIAGTLVVTWVPQAYQDGYLSSPGSPAAARRPVAARQDRE